MPDVRWGLTVPLNGIPLAACTTRKEIGEVMKRRIHFNTYAGNPVSAGE